MMELIDFNQKEDLEEGKRKVYSYNRRAKVQKMDIR